MTTFDDALATTHLQTTVTGAMLVDLARDGLPAMLTSDGLFCHSCDLDSGRHRGVSLRYSTIVLLGASRAAESGRGVPLDLGALHRRIASDRARLGPGDAGLLLWAEARHALDGAHATLAHLERRAADSRDVDERPGMEIAWMMIGAARAVLAGLPAEPLLAVSVAALERRRSARTPLYRHTAASRGRALLPNFATEIYAVLALVEAARAGAVGVAGRARALADALIGMCPADGGWPWLFDSEHGTVAERFEVYAVHQDAMAPMALFALTELTGEAAYARAAHAGLPWLAGRNPLGCAIVDVERGVVHRSIRRATAPRLHLAVNALAARAGSTRRMSLGGLERNPTDRPYHLGWVLEAWCGRAPELVQPGGPR